MSSITPVSASSSSIVNPPTASASRVPQKELGQDDFMKLLAVQFQQQDPMKPMEDTAFIGQMAQFSALAQSNTMSQTLTTMRGQQDVAVANSYLGHRVTVDAGHGQTASGDVTGVQMVNGSPQLVVSGQTYALSSVLLVEPGAVTTPVPQPANAGTN